jgi:hypothetical protein
MMDDPYREELVVVAGSTDKSQVERQQDKRQSL